MPVETAVTVGGVVDIDTPADVVFAYISNPVNQFNW